MKSEVTITISENAAQFMLDLVRQVQLGADHPQLVEVAQAVVEIKSALTEALTQEQPHEH